MISCATKQVIYTEPFDYATSQTVKGKEMDCMPLLDRAELSGNEIDLLRLVACERYNKNIWKAEYQILETEVEAYFKALEEIQ